MLGLCIKFCAGFYIKSLCWVFVLGFYIKFLCKFLYAQSEISNKIEKTEGLLLDLTRGTFLCLLG